MGYIYGKRYYRGWDLKFCPSCPVTPGPTLLQVLCHLWYLRFLNSKRKLKWKKKGHLFGSNTKWQQPTKSVLRGRRSKNTKTDGHPLIHWKIPITLHLQEISPHALFSNESRDSHLFWCSLTSSTKKHFWWAAAPFCCYQRDDLFFFFLIFCWNSESLQNHTWKKPCECVGHSMIFQFV